MAKINVLTSDVYNRISAGEVVERPKSVVKELVENSIDAGANMIQIEIEDGGITSISITDNGCGIDQDCVTTAFLPHATSKVSSYEDLEDMSTLGFRGEALASISSVSNVELSTKTDHESTGTFIELRGGVKIKHEKIDRNTGTNIVIRNLFFNTPARQKFLKRAKSEESDITGIIIGLILSNSDVSFKYFADNKLIYSSDGKGLESAIYSVYPTPITKGLINFEHNAHGLNIKGYISNPEVTRSNRNFQTTIINGRLIENITITTAVAKAYGNRLMKRNFPIFILDIVMPFDALDVNVTPSKTDVRFYDSKAVFSAVLRGVEYALNTCNKIFDMSDNMKYTQDKTPLVTNELNNIADSNIISQTNLIASDTLVESNNITENTTKFDSFNSIIKETGNITTNIITEASTQIVENHSDVNHDEPYTRPLKQDDNITCNISNSIEKIKNLKAQNTITNPIIPILNNSVRDNSYGSSVIKKVNNIQSSIFADIEIDLNTEKYNILGQVFNTYLLVEKGTGLYLIDQHAAHERLLYDNLLYKINNRAIGSQHVIAPQIINLSAVDADYILSISDQLEAIGLLLESHSTGSIKITGLPTILPNFNAVSFIDYLIEDKNSLQDISITNLLEESIAMSACKAAIKAGQALNSIQIGALIKQIEDNNPCQCPHGRPTIIRITRKDIDKLFKRIL